MFPQSKIVVTESVRKFLSYMPAINYNIMEEKF